MTITARRAVPADFDAIRGYWQDVVDREPTTLWFITCDQLPHRNFLGSVEDHDALAAHVMGNTLPLDHDLQRWLGDDEAFRLYLGEEDGRIVVTVHADWRTARLSWVHAPLAEWPRVLPDVVRFIHQDTGQVPHAEILAAEVIPLLDSVPEFKADPDGMIYRLRVD